MEKEIINPDQEPMSKEARTEFLALAELAERLNMYFLYIFMGNDRMPIVRMYPKDPIEKAKVINDLAKAMGKVKADQ